ncbi:mitochondrial metalloendopeptidase OMA1-like [Bidens hawaiensis]|uniref:mitochondrial metalloendopeptidase OMA1-like n=1 Tax=Bidens hawaiensis TaxID=980011 RepID=UPI00404ADC04
MALWFRRSKIGFDIAVAASSLRSNFTVVPKPPVSIVNHCHQLSKFTSTSNHLKSASSLIGAHFRCYHADRRLVSDSQSKLLILLVYLVSIIWMYVHFPDEETIPYTKRKHFVQMPGVEKMIGVVQFRRMQKKADAKGKESVWMHPDTLKVFFDVILALQTGLKKEDEGVKLAISHLQDLNWEVLVVQNDHAVNACCLPGGKIIVSTGLLERFKTDEEIAAIIAHEVAHVVARHVSERFSKIWFTPALMIYYKFVRPSHLVDSWATLFALDHPFSQMMETEADHIGLLLMASAGYDPRVAPKVIEKMDQVSADSGLQNYLSIQPLGKTRSKLLIEGSVMQEAISIYEEVIARRGFDT